MITSAEEFVRLRTSDSKEEYDRSIHEEASFDVWLKIVDNYPEMKIWVVGNKTVPATILERLVEDDDVAVRDAIARKRKATPEILGRLAQDSDSGVRLAVAYNAKTPRSVLTMLAGDVWSRVAEKAKERLNGA